MRKVHGEQLWSEIRHQTLQVWRDITDDDFDTLRAIRHDREVRNPRATRMRTLRSANTAPKQRARTIGVTYKTDSNETMRISGEQQ